MSTELIQPGKNPGEREAGAKPAKKASGDGGRGIAWLALLLAAASVAGTAWMWWQDEASRATGQQRLMEEIARLEAGDSQLDLKIREVREAFESLTDVGGDEIRALRDRMQQDRAQLERIERAIEDQLQRQSSVQAATESMHGRLLAAEATLANVSARDLDAGGELDLMEVDYLLRLADERLNLFGDPVSAERALEVADRHLAAVDNPTLIGVRREIAAAREALAATDLPDPLALAHRLDAVQAAIPYLPFPGEAIVAAPSEQAAETGWWEKLKAALGSLVTIRRTTEEEASQVSLEDKDYVRQRLWLQIEMAHLALMRREQEAFRRSLERASETLAAWFDGADARVQQASSDLAALAAVELRADLPDISRPWSLLRSLRAASPPAPTPAPADVTAPVPAAGDAAAAPVDEGDPAPASDSPEDGEQATAADGEIEGGAEPEDANG